MRISARLFFHNVQVPSSITLHVEPESIIIGTLNEAINLNIVADIENSFINIPDVVGLSFPRFIEFSLFWSVVASAIVRFSVIVESALIGSFMGRILVGANTFPTAGKCGATTSFKMAYFATLVARESFCRAILRRSDMALSAAPETSA